MKFKLLGLALLLASSSFSLGYYSKEPEIPKFIKDKFQGYDIKGEEIGEEQWEELLFNVEKKSLNTLSNTITKNGESLMHYAALNGSIDMVEKLLKLGYDINAKDKYGNTPLFYAIKNSSYLAFIEFLINNGANLKLNKDDKSKEDALTFALKIDEKATKRYNKSIIINYLKENNFKYEKKHFKLLRDYANNEKYLKEFIKDLKINEMYFPKYDMAYFEYIIVKANDEIIDYMIEKKVDFNTYARKQDILQNAINNPLISFNSLKKIINKGIDVNIKNGAGFTALMVAVKKGKIDRVKFLLEQGARTDLLTHSGVSAYDFIDQNGKSLKRQAEIKLLLDSFESNNIRKVNL